MGERTVLAGRYTLMSPLGRGGMGQVWEGRDERLGRPVAVKLVTADVLAGQAGPDDLVRRFTREAAVTAGFKHPGVPAIYDAGEYEGGLFLVMELVDGCTISDLIAEHGPLPVPWAAGLGAQIAAVLVVAHGRGVVHRDIKPQNVMVTADGAAKVLDFGIAGIADQRITSSGVALGTPAYMAPEQLHNLPATPRTDLYTLGCLLYEMLAGEPAFAATSPAGLMRMHLEQAPARLRRDDMPPGLEALVRQLLEKHPARRPADARETYDRLLPHVERPGPLGDIDPAADSRNSGRLYPLLLARLAGGDLPAPGLPAPAAAPGPPVPGLSAPGLPAPAAAPGLPVPGLSAPGPPAPGLSAAAPGLPGLDLSAPRAPSPQVSAGRPATQFGPNAGVGWTAAHSLWLLPTLLFGIGAWLSFGYIAARHQRASWLIIAVVYLVLAVTGITLAGSGPDTGNGPVPAQAIAGLTILLVVWPLGFLHGLWVNVRTHLPLHASGDVARSVRP